jgi:hypothetical protein
MEQPIRLPLLPFVVAFVVPAVAVAVSAVIARNFEKISWQSSRCR